MRIIMFSIILMAITIALDDVEKKLPKHTPERSVKKKVSKRDAAMRLPFTAL